MFILSRSRPATPGKSIFGGEGADGPRGGGGGGGGFYGGGGGGSGLRSGGAGGGGGSSFVDMSSLPDTNEEDEDKIVDLRVLAVGPTWVEIGWDRPLADRAARIDELLWYEVRSPPNWWAVTLSYGRECGQAYARVCICACFLAVAATSALLSPKGQGVSGRSVPSFCRIVAG